MIAFPETGPLLPSSICAADQRHVEEQGEGVGGVLCTLPKAEAFQIRTPMSILERVSARIQQE